MKRDVEQAKKLLAEAGHADGLEISIDCGNTNGPWQQQVCEILQGQLAPAGIKLNINIMPTEQYWDIWDQTPFGITAWTHRPLGTMVLSVGYRTGVPWNETQLASKEFDAALDAAEALVDVEQRRAAMEKVEKILQDAAVHGAAAVAAQVLHRLGQGAGHEGAPDAVPPVPSRLDERLMPTPSRRARLGPAAPPTRRRLRARCCCSWRAASPRCC